MMTPFDPTREAMRSLADRVAEIPTIQNRLIERHPGLTHADRVAHQQQIAGARVELRIAPTLPENIQGFGLFAAGAVHNGVGRISNGLGCPHLETDPDFLGIMAAFRSSGQRVDFLGINDAGAPTNTVAEFVALLAATAESAGVEIPLGKLGRLDLGNLTGSQLKMFHALRKRLGLQNATRIYTHIVKQTLRTTTSSSAYQQYWTGVLRLGEALGKFTFVPPRDLNRRRAISPGERYLTDDWRDRNATEALRFTLYWVPYSDERATPIEKPATAWNEAHRLDVGELVFPHTDPESITAKLFAILASEMGANPGHWIADRDPSTGGVCVAATEFEAARFLAYQASQTGRSALPEESYESVFDTGEIPAGLATELVRRYKSNKAAGHAGPELGAVTSPPV